VGARPGPRISLSRSRRPRTLAADPHRTEGATLGRVHRTGQAKFMAAFVKLVGARLPLLSGVPDDGAVAKERSVSFCS
jgi:hypothetical protein